MVAIKWSTTLGTPVVHNLRRYIGRKIIVCNCNVFQMRHWNWIKVYNPDCNPCNHFYTRKEDWNNTLTLVTLLIHIWEMQIIIRIQYYIILFYTPLSDDFVCDNVQFLKKIALWVMRHNVKPYRILISKAKVKSIACC